MTTETNIDVEKPVAFITTEVAEYEGETEPDTGIVVARRLTLKLIGASEEQIDRFIGEFEILAGMLVQLGAVETYNDVLCDKCANVEAVQS
jgi:hypothetical protein